MKTLRVATSPPRSSGCVSVCSRGCLSWARAAGEWFMEFGLSVSERALQEKARAFAQEFVAPRAAEVDRTGGYPWDIVTALAKAGFCGMTIPEAYGGKGLSYLDAVLVIEEMAKACTVTARIIVETNMGAIATVMEYGSETQKKLAENWSSPATSRRSASRNPKPAAMPLR